LIALKQHAFGFFDLGSSAWVLRRGVGCGFGAGGFFGFPLVVHAEPRFWLFLPLEAGGYVAAFFKRRWFVAHPGGRRGGGVAMASVKAYLAAGAVAGLLAGVLLAVVVVVTAVPEAVPEIAREAGVSVEEARVLYKAVLFGVAVGVGFACLFRGFLRRFCGGFLSLGSICRGLCFSSRRASWPPPSSSP
jgi:hypothetical protein